MIKKLAAAIILTAAATGAATTVGAQEQPQRKQLELKATHGAWEIRCAPDNAEACLMLQDGKRDDGQVVLKVAIQNPKGAKTQDGQPIAGLFTVEAPLGVALIPGVGIKIDGREVGRAPYQFCTPVSCIVNEPVAQKFIDQMKAGGNATMQIVGRNGQAAEVNISLSGFTKAYNSL